MITLDAFLATIPEENRYRLDQKLIDGASRARIAKSITKWRVVAQYMRNVGQNDVDAVEHDYHSLDEQKIGLLEKWKERNGPWATYRQLAKCLYDANAIDSLDALRRELVPQPSSSNEAHVLPPSPQSHPHEVPEPNMRDMTNLVKTNQPYKLGLKLNIEQRDLDLVKTDHPNDHGKQLMEVLSLYLKQTTEPSWVQVATALRTIGEGKNAKIIMDTFGLSLTGQAVETGSSPPRARVPEAVPVQSSETGSSPPTASPPEAVTARVTEAVPVRSSETAARVPEAVPVQSSETGSSPPTASPPEAVTACVPEAVPFRSSETGSSPPTAPVLDPQFLSAGPGVGSVRQRFRDDTAGTEKPKSLHPCTPPVDEIKKKKRSSRCSCVPFVLVVMAAGLGLFLVCYYFEILPVQATQSQAGSSSSVSHDDTISQPVTSTIRPITTAPSENLKWMKEQPDMKLLSLIKYSDSEGNDKSFRLVEKIQNDCKDVGEQLGIDRETLNSYDRKSQLDPEDACKDILDEWIKRGEYEVAWSGLLKALEKAHLGGVAKGLKEALTFSNME